MYSRYSRISLAALIATTLLAAGCARNEAAQAVNGTGNSAPAVSVAKVISRAVTDTQEFTGRIAAVERVEVRPRVSGYIASVNFTEGKEVAKGDLLFVIDPRPYAAVVKRVEAELARNRTLLALAETEAERANKMLASRAVSQEEYDSRASALAQAQASVQAAQAALDEARLDLSFTEVRAPIGGMVSKAEITTGNFVNSGNTLLTRLVSIERVYVEFQSDEQTYLKYTQGRQNAKHKENPVWIGLANEEGFPHQGQVVFVDNELDAATGNIRLRGLLDNHERRYTPGMFARVKLNGGTPYDAILINDSAIGTDQSVRYALVVNAQNTVEYRPLKLGPLVDGMRVVREGLTPGESVVVNGLQRVRPGAPVTPEVVAMNDQSKAADPTLLADSKLTSSKPANDKVRL